MKKVILAMLMACLMLVTIFSAMSVNATFKESTEVIIVNNNNNDNSERCDSLEMTEKLTLGDGDDNPQNIVRTIYVDDDNTDGPWDGTKEHPYQYIQDGIDAASDGDTVYVYSGTYYENIVIDKSIILEGENKDITIIDGCGNGDVVYIAVDTVTITGFTIQNNGDHTGIDVRSNYNTIYQNTVKESYNGVYLEYSSHNTIACNTITNIAQWGICLWPYSHYNNISENIVTDNGIGIVIWQGSSDNIISRNIIANNRHGLEIGCSYNNTIVDNNFVSNGITITGDSLHHWNSHTIENDYANGKPIYYYKDIHAPVIVPYDAGQVILANCSNFTVQNLDFDDVDVGIQLGYSSYCTIARNTIANNDYGIYLQGSSYNNITDCTTYNNIFNGFSLRSSSNNNIINCIAHNTSHTLITSVSQSGFRFYNSCSNKITNCTAYDNMFSGFLLLSNSSYNLITNCNSYDNGHGIALGSLFSMWGSCHNNIISRSTIIDNHKGVCLSYSSGNTMFENTIKNNDYGVSMRDLSNNNIIYHNNFINNSQNAYDECTNIWDDGRKGNYWDDYETKYPDARKILKGIWDTPYDIPGGENQDLYPWINPDGKSKSESEENDNNDGTTESDDNSNLVGDFGTLSTFGRMR